MSELMEYEKFVASKRRTEVPTGHNPSTLNENLFDFQRTIVEWAVRRGRAAIFADTGLGKTLMQLSWAHEVASHTGGAVLVLAPLAVSEQTIEQGAKFGIEVNRVPKGEGVGDSGVWITNYERIDPIDFGSLAGLVLDESSILKAHDGKTRAKIIELSQVVPYRLSCTATPSPNDFDELGNQCEFLGVMTRNEMLATYFVNDTGDTGTWKLKGWGASRFWEWMGSWSVVLRSPADLGFDGSAYKLPPLQYFEHVVEAEQSGDDLFGKPAMTLQERRKAQRDSISARCKALADVVNAEPDEDWVIWCHLNDEAEMLERLIPGSVNVKGSDSPEFKALSIQWFCDKLHFGNKLAEITKELEWAKSHISKSTTKKIAKGDCKSLLSGKKQMQSAEKNTCAHMQEQTGKSSEGLLNNKQSTTESVERPMPQMLNCESGQERKLQSGSAQTQKSGIANESKNMDSLTNNILKCSSSKVECVQYAVHQNQEGNLAVDSMSITAIAQEKSEGYCAAHAISDLGSSMTELNRCVQRFSTLKDQRKGRVLISKASMFGYGINMQHCARMAFVGLDDSFEKFYQAVRRCYRFGQKRSVQVHLFTAENEGQILANLKRKEENHHAMSENMVGYMKDIMNKELTGTKNIVDEYKEDTYTGEGFTVHLGDCVKWAKRMESDSIDYSVFSPPFVDLFTYSNSDHDMGNCTSDDEFNQQFRYLVDELFRVIKPGHNVSFHCMNLPTTKMRHGHIGVRDFRGDLIRLFQEAGFIYHSEVCIWKDPVVAMQRTKALGLLHKTIRENATMSRQGLPDYVVTMRKPGDVVDRVTHDGINDLPVDLWQKYASPVWFDIDQSKTLNKLPARDANDLKHMCPLQLDVIERCIHLWTKQGDLVFSPFTGIGSEGYMAVKMGRRFVGTELKPSYFELACLNIEDAKKEQGGLF